MAFYVPNFCCGWITVILKCLKWDKDDKDVHLTGQHGSLSLFKGQKMKINYCLFPVAIFLTN